MRSPKILEGVSVETILILTISIPFPETRIKITLMIEKLNTYD